MLRVLETKFVGNLADGLPRVEYALFCHIQGLLLNMLQGGFTRFLFQQVAQIVGREAESVGTILHGGQSFRGRFAGMEIRIQQGLEAGKDVAVQVLAGDELAVVEAFAIVEQQFDVVGDEGLAVLVHRVLQFLLNLCQAVNDRPPLLFREVEGFVGVVREIRILLYQSGKRGLA